MKKPDIAVVAGGFSSEYVVSVKSGKNVYEAIDREKFQPWLIHITEEEWSVMDGDQPLAPVDKSDFSFTLNGQKTKFDFAYVTIHGTRPLANQ